MAGQIKAGILVAVNHSDVRSTYERHKEWFWIGIAVYMCIAVVAVIGNGLVLYAAYGNRNMGPLWYLDNAVKSLAVADMLFGLIGVPCKIISDYYTGEFNSFIKLKNKFPG